MVSMKLFTLAACVSSALAEAATTPYPTTKSHTTGPAPYSTTPPVSTQTMWGLCGGLAFSFTGSIVCTSIASCAHFNNFYWQCIPPATTTTVATTTSSKPVYPPTTTASTTKTKTLVSLTLPPVSTTTTSRAASSTGGATWGVPAFGQCGGTGFTGNTVCVAGTTCVKENEFFSQCFADNPISSSTTKAATTTTSKAASSTGTLPVGVPVFFQCGGQFFTGPTVCVAGATCVKLNDFFSQCLKDNPTPPSTTKAATTLKYV